MYASVVVVVIVIAPTSRLGHLLLPPSWSTRRQCYHKGHPRYGPQNDTMNTRRSENQTTAGTLHLGACILPLYLSILPINFDVADSDHECL